MRRMRRTPVLLVLVLLVACTTGNLAATGQSLDALGQQFLTVGTQLKTAHATGQVTDAQYAKWVAFVPNFKVGFSQANQAWQTANKAGDLNAPGATVDLILALKNQLLQFALGGVTP